MEVYPQKMMCMMRYTVHALGVPPSNEKLLQLIYYYSLNNGWH